LCAFLHRFGGQRLVVQARQHNHWDAWRYRVRPPHSFETMTIRQSHVQKDDIHRALRKMNLGVTHAHQMRQFETARSLFTEHLAEQTDISRIILNQKNS
jgi:hypothetical protein